jgi:hypothetical protein
VQPAELLQLRNDPLAAWSLNNAVSHFGSALEEDIEKLRDKEGKISPAKEMMLLHRWGLREMKFRDPAKSQG